MSTGIDQIATKSVYEPPQSGDGKRILITQYWPRGIARAAVHEYLRTLSPSRDLLRAFKHGGIGREAFEAAFRQEMQRPEARAEIERLAHQAEREKLTLLCLCEREDECHRRIVRELVEAAG